MTSELNAHEMNLSRARMLLEDIPGVVLAEGGPVITVEVPVAQFAMVGAILKEKLGCLYFAFLNEAGQGSGGASYPGFLANIRDEALALCTDAQRGALKDLTGDSFTSVWPRTCCWSMRAARISIS